MAYLHLLTQKAIIFTHTIDQVEFLHYVLANTMHRKNDKTTNIPCLSQKFFLLHGNVPQEERIKTYNEFKTTKLGSSPFLLILDSVLICTDVASRGLDFNDVKNTILLDMPESFTEYTHRIGRTARLDKPGNSLLILFEKAKSLLRSPVFWTKSMSSTPGSL